ncbi:MAG: VWA domain-containing protein [Chloroherpetonaceae bacterium]|nr:VWA domain-containing protein [Chloroherpetonaceae bacterium]MDW8438744.1 VWA domain-containing protein [Chloroherpetonaceae bacterium]
MKRGLLCFCLTLSLSLQAQTKGEFEELKRRYNLAAQHTDFVIMVDFSGSMKRGNAYQHLYNVLADLVDAIPDGDYLSIQGFSSDIIRNPAGRPVILNRGNREALKQKIRAMPVPQGYTDIGRAIELCNEELNRPEANTLQFLLFITDGKHDALPNSPYYRKTSGKEWDKLREQAELTLYRQGRKLRVVALALTGAEDAPIPDTKLLQQVYRNVQLEEVGQADVPSLKLWFNRLQREIEREKLKALALTDLQKPFECKLPDTIFVREFSGKTTRLSYPLRLQSNAEGLDFIVKEVKYIGKYEEENLTVEFKANINQAKPLRFAPKAADSSLTLSVADFPLHESFISKEFLDKLQGNLEITADLEPASELAKLGIKPENFTVRIPIMLSVKETIGFPLWLIALVGIVVAGGVAGAGAWTYSTFIKPEYINAKFEITLNGGGIPRTVQLRAHNKKDSLKIGGEGAGEARIDGVDVPTVEFFTEKGLQRGLYARMKNGAGTLIRKEGNKERQMALQRTAQKVVKNRTRVETSHFTVEVKT